MLATDRHWENKKVYPVDIEKNFQKYEKKKVEEIWIRRTNTELKTSHKNTGILNHKKSDR